MRTSYRKIAFCQYPAECAVCQSAENLEVHHKDRDRSNNHIDNLQILCTPCHRKQHVLYPGEAMVNKNFQIPLSLKQWIEAEAVRRSAATGEKVSTAEVVREAVTKLRDAA